MAAVAAQYRMSLCLSKEGDARFMGHLDLLRLMERSLRRSGLPLQHTNGFNPRIKLCFADALPVGTASSGEWLTVILNEDLAPDVVRARLAQALPSGMVVVDAVRGAAPLGDGPVRYRLDIVSGAESAADALAELLARDEYTVTDPRRGRTVDVRSQLVSWSAHDDHVVVDLVAVNGRPPRPAPLVLALCEIAGLHPGEVPRFGVCTKQLSVERRHGDRPWQDADEDH